MKTGWHAVQLITLSVLVATLAACSTNPTKITGASTDGFKQMRSELDTKIPRVVEKHNLSSMVVLVLDDQDVVYAKGFGYSDTSNQQITSTDTAYRIGSITKLFTAIAILQLQEQGKLQIDNSVQNYLPGFSIKTSYGLESITLRGMLSHYSGMPSDYNHGFNNYLKSKTIVADLKEETVAFKPGDTHAYSNLSYGLLGHVIEHVSGQSYEDYIMEHIINPLGMTNASFGNSVVPGFAIAHDNGELIEPVEIRDVAAGDLRMSADDLALFAREMLKYTSAKTNFKPKLLSHKSVQEMWSPQYADAPLDSGFDMGLGWILSYPSKELANVPSLVWHNGGTFHYTSSLMISRAEKIAVIVLVNSAKTSPVSDVIAQNTLIAAIRSKSGFEPEPFQPTSSPISQFSADQVSTLSGRYFAGQSGEILVQGDQHKLTARSGKQKMTMVPMDDGSFGIKLRLFGFIPFTPAPINDLRFRVIDYDGDYLIKLDRGPVIAQKIENKTLPDSMNQYLGRYELTNPEKLHELAGFKGMNVSNANGYLRAELKVKEENQVIHFDVLTDGRARVMGYGRGLGGSVLFYNDEKDRPAIVYSGLKFVRTE